MKILRASGYKRMPWKNGGGETVEIAVFPAGASLDDFGWRVSMATVASDGPFSSFPQVDRTLSILSGAGMTLRIGGAEPTTLDLASTPHPFAADAPTSATLVNGAITDLNVMTRRGRYSHMVSRRAAPFSLPASGALTLVLSTGELSVTSDAEKAKLDPLDCLVLEAGSANDLFVSGEGSAFVIELRAEGGE
jgi:environmental stress-induced protein Ves